MPLIRIFTKNYIRNTKDYLFMVMNKTKKLKQLISFVKAQANRIKPAVFISKMSLKMFLHLKLLKNKLRSKRLNKMRKFCVKRMILK